MLRHGWGVKVLDFGLARWSDLGGQTHHLRTAVSPPEHGVMSPEHYRNQPLTNASDVFALGLVLFELSTGGHPFPRRCPLEALYAIANRRAPTLNSQPAHSRSLDSLILAMLAKDPGRTANRKGCRCSLEG